jgi:hypothetical protein
VPRRRKAPSRLVEIYPPSLDTGLKLYAFYMRYGTRALELFVCHRYLRTWLYVERHPGTDWRHFGGERKEKIVGEFLDRALAKVTSERPEKTVPKDPKFLKHMKALAEFLFDTGTPDHPRETSTLNISWAPSEGFKVFLNERNIARYICVTSDTLEGALAALEGRLQSDDPEWRQQKNSAQKGRKRA